MSPIIVLILWVLHFTAQMWLDKSMFHTGCLLVLYTAFTILDLLKQEGDKRVRRANSLKILDDI